MKPTFRSDDAGDPWWRAEMQVTCRARSHPHQYQVCHFLGYDPAGGFPSPPTTYQRGRRAQNLSRSRDYRAPAGLDLYKFEHDGRLLASGRNPCLRTHRLAPPAHAFLCRPVHHRPSVKDRNPHGRRRALRAAPGRPFGAVGPDPAPSRGGTPKWLSASDTIATNGDMPTNVTYGGHLAAVRWNLMEAIWFAAQ